MDSIMVEKESGGESSPVQPQGGAPSPATHHGGRFDIPSINLPKGSGTIRGIGSNFAANPVTGTGSMSVSIATSPGRSGFGPVKFKYSNLGHIIAPNTVKNILKRHGIEPAPEREQHASWQTSLKAHWGLMAAKDFFTVGAWTPCELMTYYVLFIMHLSTRSVHIAGVTTAPNCNAFAERFVRPIKEECLSRMILFGEADLRRALREYRVDHHIKRNHQGVSNRLLESLAMDSSTNKPMHCSERLGGMLACYYREAA